MTRPIRTRTVIGERPAQAPQGWVIFNAPRPIFGTYDWKGDFISGVFYTAVDPLHSGYERIHELNRQQDAVILTYISEEEAYEKGKERLLSLYPNEAKQEIINDPQSRSWIVEGYLRNINHPKEVK